MTRRRPGPALHAVLLAGGSGTRFWPWSRVRRPKQLLPLSGGESLLRATWRRARKLAPPSRVWVVAPRTLRAAVRRELPELARDRLIVEPAPRDTAPAIALACAAVARADSGRAIVCILPSDQVVQDPRAFERAVRVAAQEAARGSLVCLGVPPDRPATGFGYLECERVPRTPRPVRVARFVEKPDATRARAYLASGRHLWNAGIFVWEVDRFLDEVRRRAPAVSRAVAAHLEGRAGAWARSPRISVDYAVLEKAAELEVVPLRAGWDDVGSWEAMVRLGRPRSTDVLALASDGSAVFGETKRFVALVGVPGVVVVDTPDALLVLARDRAEDVKRLVAGIRSRDRGELL